MSPFRHALLDLLGLAAALLASSLPGHCQVVYSGQSIPTRPTVPANSVGVENSWYLDQTTGQMFGPKTLGTWSATPTVGFASTLGSFSNTTAAIADPTTFFNPTYFSNPATGISYHFNRIQAGIESLSSDDVLSTTPNQTVASWVASYVGTMAYAQIASTSSLGEAAIAGASRTSDYHTWLPAGHSGGPGAVVAVGVNDDTTGGNPINCTFCAFQFQLSGVTGGISLSQFDSNNYGAAVVPVTSGITGGTTWGLGLTAGALITNGLGHNSSGALYIGPGHLAAYQFEVGINFLYNALDIAVGSGGSGVALNLAGGQSFRWQNHTNDATYEEMWGDATGFHFADLPAFIGTAAAPTQVSGQGSLWGTAGGGLNLGGSGASADVTLTNSANAAVFEVLHASTTAYIPHGLLIGGNATIQNATAIPAGGSSSAGLYMSSTANFGIFFGSGAPTLSAAQGSIYLRSDGSSTSTRLYINTNGTTGWTNVVTGS